MQDEVNEKTVSLCIRGGKITAQLLKAAMRKALAQMEQEKAKQKQQSKVQKQQDDRKTNHGEADAAECTAFQY